MKKLIVGLLLVFLFTAWISSTAFAAELLEPVTDYALLLTEEEQDALNEKALEIIEQYQCEVAVVTVNSLDGKDAFTFAKSLYTEYGFGKGSEQSGLLLLLSMEDRDYALIAYGYGNTAFTDYGKDVLLDKHVKPLLGKDKYYEAFSTYLNKSAEYLAMARSGAPFDTDTDPAYGKLPLPMKLGITLLLPIIIAGVICLTWKSKMKSAIAAKDADRYIPSDGLRLTGQEDQFLFRTETRRRIESRSSRGGGTSTGSDGFSGRSGKF